MIQPEYSFLTKVNPTKAEFDVKLETDFKQRQSDDENGSLDHNPIENESIESVNHLPKDVKV